MLKCISMVNLHNLVQQKHLQSNKVTYQNMMLLLYLSTELYGMLIIGKMEIIMLLLLMDKKFSNLINYQPTKKDSVQTVLLILDSKMDLFSTILLIKLKLKFMVNLVKNGLIMLFHKLLLYQLIKSLQLLMMTHQIMVEMIKILKMVIILPIIIIKLITIIMSKELMKVNTQVKLKNLPVFYYSQNAIMKENLLKFVNQKPI